MNEDKCELEENQSYKDIVENKLLRGNENYILGENVEDNTVLLVLREYSGYIVPIANVNIAICPNADTSDNRAAIEKVVQNYVIHSADTLMLSLLVGYNSLTLHKKEEEDQGNLCIDYDTIIEKLENRIRKLETHIVNLSIGEQ